MNRLTLIALMLGLVVSASAQTNRKLGTGKVPATAIGKGVRAKAAIDPAIQSRIDQQLQAVEQVTFIDSIIVPQSELFQHINIGVESGFIMPVSQFFKTGENSERSLYETQMHDRIIYPLAARGKTGLHLVECDSLFGEWSKPQTLKGLESEDSQNYPFLMADGQTLYFAAQGGESLGGYDIFMTRYDTDSRTWLTPQSIGMPFNSTANDYLYIIDEYNQLGYFVTDRKVQAGYVCIYTFIPSETRNTYDATSLSHEELVGYAEITDIRRTWTDRRAVNEALERKASLAAHGLGGNSAQQDLQLVINDRLTYTTLSQFHNAEARQQAEYWLETRRQLSEVESRLDALRTQYNTDKSKRIALKPTILQLEQQQEKILEDLCVQEKNIRALECR